MAATAVTRFDPKIIREPVTCQYVEADRAICGHGDLMLVPALARHRLTVDVCITISPIQRQKASDACFKALAHASQPTLVTSTNGLLTVPTTPGAGKKLNQKRLCHII